MIPKWVEDPTWRRLVVQQAERTLIAYRCGPECHAQAVADLAALIFDAEAWDPDTFIFPCAEGVQ